MRPNRKRNLPPALGAMLTLFLASSASVAQDVRVAAQEVSDDRYSQANYPTKLEVKFKLSGDGADGVQAARVFVKAARDDQGTSLLPDEPAKPDFDSLDSSLALKATLKNPARKASAITVSGTAELFAPKRDPNSVVTVANAFAKLNKQLSAPGLKASKVEVTLLSKERYAEEQKKKKPDEKALAEIRAEGKKRGASDKEIDDMLKLVAAMQDAFGQVSENGVILTGPKKSMEMIHSVKILDPSGEEIHIGSTTGQGDEKTKTMIFEPSKPVPPNASLRFTLLTEKARFSVPFEVKDIPLP